MSVVSFAFFLPAYKPPPGISPPADRPINKDFRIQISPGLVGEEIQCTLVSNLPRGMGGCLMTLLCEDVPLSRFYINRFQNFEGKLALFGIFLKKNKSLLEFFSKVRC